MNRHTIIVVMDVQNGNPNGDPDAGNAPRQDPQTGHGFITDMCVKRKVRDFVALTKDGQQGFGIFMSAGNVLNSVVAETLDSAKLKKGANGAERAAAVAKRFYDVRTFGAVLATGENKTQNITGPVQVSYARSVDPILVQESCITSCVVANEEQAKKQEGETRNMGRKNTVPYAVYILTVSVDGARAQKTGFSDEDLKLLLDGLAKGWETSQSAGRGIVTVRKLIDFEHDSPLGSVPTQKLLDLIKVKRKEGVEFARAYEDYEVKVCDAPRGVQVHQPYDLW